MNKRTSETRSGDSRASETSPRKATPSVDHWSPVAQLETPQALNGYRYRWIREEVNGVRDSRNMTLSKREGYEFVHVEEAMELGLMVDDDNKEDGLARHGGLVLAKIPEEFCQQREAHYARKRRDNVAAANRLQGVGGELPVSFEDRGSGVKDVGNTAAQTMSEGG